MGNLIKGKSYSVTMTVAEELKAALRAYAQDVDETQDAWQSRFIRAAQQKIGDGLRMVKDLEDCRTFRDRVFFVDTTDEGKIKKVRPATMQELLKFKYEADDYLQVYGNN